METITIECYMELPPAFICREVGHRWKYPLAWPGDGNTVFYRWCAYCNIQELGRWERKGVTDEKLESLITTILENFPRRVFLDDVVNYEFCDIYKR